MRTTLELDKKLLEDVSTTTGERTLSKAVTKALREYLRQQRKERLIASLGTRDLDLGDWYEVRHAERT
jgi:hypothetical protein